MNEMERILMDTMHARADEMPERLELDGAAVDKANKKHNRKIAGIGAMSLALVVAVGAIGYSVIGNDTPKSNRVATNPIETTAATSTTAATNTTAAPAPRMPSRLVADVNNKLAIVNSANGQVEREFSDLTLTAYTAAASADGKTLFAIASQDCDGTGSPALWAIDASTGEHRALTAKDIGGGIRAVSPSGRYLVLDGFGCGGGTEVVDTVAGTSYYIDGGAGGPYLQSTSSAFIDETHLAVGYVEYKAVDGQTSASYGVRVVDVQSQQLLPDAPLRFTKDLEVDVLDAATIDGRDVLVVTTGDNPNKVRLWDARSGDEISVLAQLPKAGKDIRADLDPTGRFLVTTQLGEVRTWVDGTSTVVPGISSAIWLPKS